LAFSFLTIFIKIKKMAGKKEPFPELFREAVGEPLRENVRLRDFSSFRIGGPADYFFCPASPGQLKASLDLARRHSLPWYIIGGGYNLLFADEGFRGLILRNGLKGVKREGGPREIEVSSGTDLGELVRLAKDAGLSGLEFLSGIPGSVGGAVCGNAGAFGQSVGDFLKEAVLLSAEGEERTASRDYFEFQYRHSCLKKDRNVLISAVFELEPGDRIKTESLVEDYLQRRKAKHPPWSTACAGSYFKNPVMPDGTKVAAGYLLEQVGAKSLRVGEAAVYSGHANFIINLGGARSCDVRELARLLKERVKEQFGVELEEEVIYLPAAGGEP
jgi:UDP-N-acetylmuramate dehydrogenase